MRLGTTGPSLGAIVVLVIAIVLLVRGAGGDGDSGNDDPAPTAEEVTVQVVDIVDGDTIEVSLDGEVEDVRYIGIDTPESVKPDAPVECFGEESSRRNASLVEGRRVRLVFDAERRDQYGRLLAYVYADELFVNAELLRQGYARTLTIAPNDSFAERFARLQQGAAGAGRGLWSACGV